MTAVVVNDLLGGELLRERFMPAARGWATTGGTVWCLRAEIDLAREQFGPEEIVTGGTVVPGPPVAEWRRLRDA